MKSYILILFLSFSLCHGADISKAAKSNNALAADLYFQLAQEEGNLFFSPISLSSALSIPYMGAKEDTLEQMSAVLHFDADADENGRSFGALTQHLLNGSTLDLCNSLWIQKDFAILPQFLSQVAHHFIASIHYADYRRESEKAREEINHFVEESTRGQIKDLLPEGTVNPDSRAVIINTIYLNADWANPFDASETYPQPFNLEDGTAKEVQMMHGRGYYLLDKRKNYTLLELPYLSQRCGVTNLACYILLPDEGVSLSEVEAKAFHGLFKKMNSCDVAVSLPKVSLETTIPMKACLEKMGLSFPFSCMADFSGITGSPDLYISDVIQKAKLKIDEKGTEAAAATGIIMNTKCAIDRGEPVYFTADRPFMFFIADKTTRNLLFVGRFVQP